MGKNFNHYNTIIYFNDLLIKVSEMDMHLSNFPKMIFFSLEKFVSFIFMVWVKLDDIYEMKYWISMGFILLNTLLAMLKNKIVSVTVKNRFEV